jgi:uncharacterized membrane protein affecting hemolysin expression
MRCFRNLSIKRKLITIIMLTSGVALLLACSAFVIYELLMYRVIMTRELSTIAQIVSETSTAALAFNDQRAARETLAVLKAEPRIVAGCIYTSDGRVFAKYVRGSKPAHVSAPGEDANPDFSPRG